MLKRLYFTIAVTTLTSAPVLADEVDLLSLSLEDLLSVKVVASTLHSESLKSVPASVTVITREEIRSLGATTLEQILNLVPGYQTSRLGITSTHNTTVSRGKRTGAASKEVLVLLDGQRLNDDFAGGALFVNRQPSLDNVERIEFIRGPGSTLYGSNAFMGVINIITGSSNEFRVSARLGEMIDTSLSYNKTFREGAIDIYARTQNDKGVDITLYNPNSQTFMNSSDPYENYELYVKGQWQSFNSKVRITSRESNNFLVTNRVGFDGNHWNSDSVLMDFGYEKALTKNTILKSSVFYSDSTVDVDSTIVLDPFRGTENDYRLIDSGAYVSLTYNNGEGQRSLAGLEYRRPDMDKATSTGVGNTNNTEPVVTTEQTARTISGFYLQHQDKINDSTSYILGARLDEYSDIGSHLSPRLGLVYDFNEATTVKLLYAESFRAPSRIDKDITNHAIYLGNDDLKPEIAKTWELVAMCQGKNAFLSATVFSTRIEDNIINVPIPDSTQLTRANGDESGVAGVELEWQTTITKHYRIRAAASHLYEPLLERNNEADTVLAASVSYQHDNLTINIAANYHSEKEDVNNSDLGYLLIEPRTLFTGNITYHHTSTLDVYLRGDNLLDEAFVSPSQSARNIYGIPNRGRTFETGLRWRF